MLIRVAGSAFRFAPKPRQGESSMQSLRPPPSNVSRQRRSSRVSRRAEGSFSGSGHALDLYSSAGSVTPSQSASQASFAPEPRGDEVVTTPMGRAYDAARGDPKASRSSQRGDSRLDPSQASRRSSQRSRQSQSANGFTDLDRRGLQQHVSTVQDVIYEEQCYMPNHEEDPYWAYKDRQAERQHERQMRFWD